MICSNIPHYVQGMYYNCDNFTVSLVTHRVTPSGQIEDDGDFSDFYTVPPDASEYQKKAIQEVQDEVCISLTGVTGF